MFMEYFFLVSLCLQLVEMIRTVETKYRHPICILADLQVQQNLSDEYISSILQPYRAGYVRLCTGFAGMLCSIYSRSVILTAEHAASCKLAEACICIIDVRVRCYCIQLARG